MRIILNGRLVEVADGATVADVKSEAGLPAEESLVEVSGTSARRRDEDEVIKPDAKYRSIPPVKQG